MSTFFGIENWFYRNVADLSGGEKQILNLASIMVMMPSVLILDEPTSQLDPIAATDFLSMVYRIHRDFGTTIIMTEHRLENVYYMCDSVFVLEEGLVIASGKPRTVAQKLKEIDSDMMLSLPSATRIWASLSENTSLIPLSVGEGRTFINEYMESHTAHMLKPEKKHTYTKGLSVVLDKVWYRYDRDSEDIIKELSLTIHKGEFLAILGANGAGKSTTLKMMAGLIYPYKGEVLKEGTIAYLPQDPKALFLKDTVKADLLDVLSVKGYTKKKRIELIKNIAALCGLENLLNRHPFDLSGGEQERAAIAKLILVEPDILLLDEPTKGLEADFKSNLAEIFEAMLNKGTSIIMVSHDVEFCASHAHRCALFFDGNITASGTPREFFGGNNFYTTATNRIMRDIKEDAITCEDVAAVFLDEPDEEIIEKQKDEDNSLSEEIDEYIEKENFIKRNLVKIEKKAKSFSLPQWFWVIVIGITVALGQILLDNRKYYFIAVLVVIEILMMTFIGFEKKKPKPRKIVIMAVLVALGIAGRAALFMLPHFKPVLALTVITAIAFGSEDGFLVGALVMLLSNILFGQGPWTPWQMFAMGTCGYLAGILYKTGIMPVNKIHMSIFGAISAIVLYGGIMNPASCLIYMNTINWKILLSYFATGLPVDLVHGFATALFLFIGGEPIISKINRIKDKYGLE